MGEKEPYGDLRDAKWLDPECYGAGACQSLKFKASEVRMPKEPPPGLLMSMAIRFDHGLGVPGYYDQHRHMAVICDVPPGPTHAQRLESTLRQMRQLYEEVSGHGFYSKAKEDEYAALARSMLPNFNSPDRSSDNKESV